MRLLAFLICLVLSLPAAADWLEDIDRSLGGAWFGITGQSCADASYGEYVSATCLGYFHPGYQSFRQYEGQRGGTDFFEGVTDAVIFNAAANDVYQMNKCQKEFYELYQANGDERNDLDGRAWTQFGNVQRYIRESEQRMDSMARDAAFESGSTNCFTSSECAMDQAEVDKRYMDRLSPELERQNALVNSIPMGNRPQMRRFLIDASKNASLTQAAFLAGYQQVMRELQAEANGAFAQIYSKSDPDPNAPNDPNRRLFRVIGDGGADLRRTLVSNGIVQSTIIKHHMERQLGPEAMCRYRQTYEVGPRVRVVGEIAATILIPYGAAALTARAGLMAAEAGSAIVRGTALATRAFMPAVLFGTGASMGLLSSNDIHQSCFPPEYMASKRFDGCNAEKQMYEVKVEANIAMCVLSAELNLVLPIAATVDMARGLKAFVGVATAEDMAILARQRAAADVGAASGVARPTPRATASASPEAQAVDEIVVTATRRPTATPAENRSYIALTRGPERSGTVFVDSQNRILKFLNDNLKNKGLVDSLNAQHNAMIEEAIEGFLSRNPEFSLRRYTDYKGVRFAIVGPPGSEARVMRELRGVLDGVDRDFMLALRRNDQLGPRVTETQWHCTGIACSADEANVQTRFPPGTTTEQIQASFRGVEDQRAALQASFGESPLMAAISPGSRLKTPTAEVFEVLRKNSDDAIVAGILNARHRLTLTTQDIQRFRRYATDADRFSPGLLLDQRVEHDFSQAATGGGTVDFAGVGALNAEATARGLAAGRGNYNRALRAVRTQEGTVTTYLDTLKANTSRAIEDTLRAHGLRAEITISGDDLVFIPNGPLTPTLRQELVLAQARAGVPSSLRISFFGEAVPAADRAVLAAEGEGIEKILRTRLESQLTPEELRNVTFATDMRGQARGTGAVGLLTNPGLAPERLQIVRREFAAAIADNNARYGTSFSVAP